MNNAKEYYNVHSVGYVDKWDLSEQGLKKPANYYRLQIIESLLGLAEITPGERIVEVGCGTGLVLAEAVKITKPIFGTDISQSMIERVKDSLLKDKKVVIVKDFSLLPPEPNVDVYLMQNDFLNLNVPKNYFDKILSMEVIRYIDDLPTCFKNVRNVMKDDSLFVFTGTNPYSLSLFPLKYTIRKWFNKIDKQKELLQYFTSERKIKKLLRDAGLEIVTFKKMNLFSFNPFVESVVKTSEKAEKVEKWNKRFAKVPLINHFFDTFVIAVRKAK